MLKFISILFFLTYYSLLYPAQVANESVVTGALVHDYRGIELGSKGHLLTAKQEFVKALKYMPWFDRSLLNLKICTDALNERIDKKFAVSVFKTLNFLSTTDSLKALNFTDNFLKNNKGYGSGYLIRAQIYLRLMHPEEALADYNSAISLSPKDELAYYFRGRLYAQRKRYGLARDDFTKAITLKPLYAQAYLVRGDAYSAQGKYNEAVADYEIALQAWPKWGKRTKVFAAYLNKGINNIRLGKTREALVDLNKAISLKPKTTEAYFNRGITYQKLNLLNKAITDFNYVIGREPRNIEAYFNRGFSWQKERDYDAAAEDYLKVIKLDSNHVKAYFRLGEVYTKQREFGKVIPAFAKVIQLNPEKYWAYYWQALAYDRLKMYDKAVRSYNIFLEKALRKDKHQILFSRKRIERLTKYLVKKS